MTQLKSMNEPTHQDFLEDPNLSLDQIGALALMTKSDGPFTGDWLFQTRPSGTRGSVGRTRSQRIMRGLKDLGYADAKTVRVEGVTRICTSIRGSLKLPFSQVGPLISEGKSAQSIAVAAPVPLKIQSTEIAIRPEVVEAELVDDQEVAIVTTKKARKPTMAQQTKAVSDDPRWKVLLEAYRTMLKDLDKIGNLGDLAYARKQFLELSKDFDEDPTLMADIVATLTKYRVGCKGYPVSLMKYLRDRVWENYPPEAESDWSAFHE